MSEDIEVRKRILNKSYEMFSQFGFSKVTMEEISAGLGISKKTLYKHFGSKELIVKELVNSHKCQISERVSAIIHDEQTEFPEKLRSFLNFIGNVSLTFNGPLMADMMRSLPEVWCEIEEFRAQRAYENVKKLMEEGVAHGVFRNDISVEVLVRLYVGAIHHLINPGTLQQIPLSTKEIFSQTMKILFEGILTDAGREQYSTNHLHTNVPEGN